MFYVSGKVNLKIYESTKVLYKVDQVQRKSNKIPVLIMNNLTDGSSESSFLSYYSEVDIGSGLMGGEKKTFEEKKCLAVPISFEREGLVEKDTKLFILAEWNYY